MCSKKNIFWLLAISLSFTSCETIDLYEKNVTVPGHSWSSGFKPSFTFTIKDTTVPYRVFLVLRHTEKYNFNNIYINLYTRQPGVDSLQKGRFDLQLANPDKGWLGTGMDDIYEHRIALAPADQDLYFRRSGDYTFQVEQIMREDPLQHVMNVGIRVEKKL